MIIVNLDKAKSVAHDLRRAARAAAFAPHDEIIAKRIPGVSAREAEAAREEIRTRFASIQDQIEASASVETLNELIGREGLKR